MIDTNTKKQIAIIAPVAYGYLGYTQGGLTLALLSSAVTIFILYFSGVVDTALEETIGPKHTTTISRGVTIVKITLGIIISALIGLYLFRNEGFLFALVSFVGFLLLLDASDIITCNKRPFWWFLLVIVTFRTFCYDVMYVPSGSMTPTLLHGDFVLVKKAEYGFNKESLWPFGKMLPFLPSYMHSEPKRGEIVVWTREKDGWFKYYVKRAVGISGDVLQMVDGILHINNTPSQLEYIGTLPYDHDEFHARCRRLVSAFKETNILSDFDKTIIRDQELGAGYGDNTHPILVPSKHFAVIGDNRTNGGSWDSRDMTEFPPMPYTQIIGKPKLVLFSSSSWTKQKPDMSWAYWVATLPVRIASALHDLRYDRNFKNIQN